MEVKVGEGLLEKHGQNSDLYLIEDRNNPFPFELSCSSSMWKKTPAVESLASATVRAVVCSSSQQ